MGSRMRRVAGPLDFKVVWTRKHEPHGPALYIKFANEAWILFPLGSDLAECRQVAAEILALCDNPPEVAHG